jgi:general secretion pathway protein L
VISPKFRIEQLLKTDATAQQGAFWYLLEQLVQAVPHTKQVVIEQLRFQNQSIVVNLTSDTFATLESFENDLKKSSLQVTQTQASSNDKRVTATLELRA